MHFEVTVALGLHRIPAGKENLEDHEAVRDVIKVTHRSNCSGGLDSS